jgi:hypothetical protein
MNITTISKGYGNMPLERMAYELGARYVAGGPVADVLDCAQKFAMS